MAIVAVVVTSPARWSLLSSLVGIAMLVAGVVADRRLLAWARAVRAGERTGWRVEPAGAREADAPALVGTRPTAEMDGLLVLDRAGSPQPVAWMFLEGSDRRRLVSTRLRAAGTAVALLLAIVPAVLLVVGASVPHAR